MTANILTLLKNATISMPVIELCILITALSIFLVFKFTRSGLILAYLFTYRWGLLFFLKEDNTYLMFYLIFGFAVGILTIVSMMWSTTPSE